MRARRLTVRTRTWLALTVMILPLAVACDGDPQGQGAAATSPDTSFLDPIANPQDIRDLFTVETADPEYWRVFSLDTYNGESWTKTIQSGSGGPVHLSTPTTLPQADDGSPPEGATLIQTFQIVDDLQTAGLPVAQTAEEISGSIGDITWDPEAGAGSLDGDLEAGMKYTVRSQIVVPTAEQLDRVDIEAGTASGRWTRLPDDLDPRIGEIAEEWTANATSDYGKVLAIQQRFQRDDFIYSTAVDTSVGDDALVEFLTRTKAGFCVHYSSATALMVRTLGLPARLGVGFRAGTLQEDGRYLVTTDDAHVWVEVLFPGYGWLQFEPEHGTAHPNAQPSTYLNPS